MPMRAKFANCTIVPTTATLQRSTNLLGAGVRPVTIVPRILRSGNLSGSNLSAKGDSTFTELLPDAVRLRQNFPDPSTNPSATFTIHPGVQSVRDPTTRVLCGGATTDTNFHQWI